MKNPIKYLASAALAILVAFSVSSTYAQRGGRGGGGGGGFHGGGGGGGFHSGGGSFGGRGGGSFSSGSHGSFGGNRQSAAPQGRSYSQSPGRVDQRSNSGYRSYNGDSRASATPFRGQAHVYGGSARGGVYNRGYGYSGRNGVYYHGGYRSAYRNFYGGYYNRFYAPHIGLRINVLPYGYYPFYYGDDQFYYNNGLFYQQYDNGSDYTVVEPPMGAIVPNVPQDAKGITIDGIQYYELNGVYYQPVTNDDGTTAYKIVGKDGELNTDQSDDVYPEDNNNQGN